MIKIYGIKNCNSVKKALDYLNENGISYEFHDYKKLSITHEELQNFIDKFGLEQVLNKKGTTWRKLDKSQQEQAVETQYAIKLMTENTSLIKRPIIYSPSKHLIGFNPKQYQDTFQ